MVKRYAHLSQTYLKGVVEGVSIFGKESERAIKNVAGLVEEKREESDAPVTKTGTEAGVEKGSRT